jgi:hypothetical protein
LQQSVIQADETTLKVIGETKSPAICGYIAVAQCHPKQNPIIVPSSILANLVAFMAHARRKFVEAETAHRRADQPKDKSGEANWALNHIQNLCRIETKIKSETTQKNTEYAGQKPYSQNSKTGWISPRITHGLSRQGESCGKTA